MRKLHRDLNVFCCEGGLFDVEPCELDLDVGRRGRRVNPDTKKLGTISREPFEVVGVQKDYSGRVCYRIVHDTDAHRFGCVLSPSDKIEWLTDRV